MSNMDLWDSVSTTDMTYTKHRDKPYPHTDISASYMFREATRQFGPFGTGWGATLDEPQIIPLPTDEIMCRVRVHLWYIGADGERHNGPSVDGSKFLVAKTKRGLSADDEALKKAAADGIKKGLSMLGFCSDIFLGQIDGPSHSAPAPSKSAPSESKPKPSSAPSEDAPTCPECDAPMRKRHSQYGDFWGCSNYPTCTGKRHIDEDAGNAGSDASESGASGPDTQPPYPDGFGPTIPLPKTYKAGEALLGEVSNDYLTRLRDKGTGIPKQVAVAELWRREHLDRSAEPDDGADKAESEVPPCPGCGNASPKRDAGKGELTCPNCGIVYDYAGKTLKGGQLDDNEIPF